MLRDDWGEVMVLLCGWGGSGLLDVDRLLGPGLFTEFGRCVKEGVAME